MFWLSFTDAQQERGKVSHLSHRLGNKRLSAWLCALPPACLPHPPSSSPVTAGGAGVPRAWSSPFWAHSMHLRCVVFKYKVLCPLTTLRSLPPAQTPTVSARPKLWMASCPLAPSRALPTCPVQDVPLSSQSSAEASAPQLAHTQARDLGAS